MPANVVEEKLGVDQNVRQIAMRSAEDDTTSDVVLTYEAPWQVFSFVALIKSP